MILMLVCMFVTTPMMIQFANFEALAGQKGYAINQFALGNLGGSMTYCTTVPYTDIGAKINLQCNTGSLNVDTID